MTPLYHDLRQLLDESRPLVSCFVGAGPHSLRPRPETRFPPRLVPVLTEETTDWPTASVHEPQTGCGRDLDSGLGHFTLLHLPEPGLFPLMSGKSSDCAAASGIGPLALLSQIVLGTGALLPQLAGELVWVREHLAKSLIVTIIAASRNVNAFS
ncbi:unnamed protein product [Protopolystoma xenopodis]|uniref:Uncharacterized protein n=1 Tax=Protopolystoma xenopodis TaxID=117903 RepID=A0A3S5ABL3_9PLAT|nr:unnamed protein product [Protopolystoma xenopodis]